MLAIVLSALLALITDATELMGILFIPFWLALYYGWPYLSRRLPFLDFEKTPANPAPMRPLWLRLIRGTVALVGSIVLVMCLMSLTVVVPIAVCFHRAKKAHDAIHVGMTVSEVLHTAGNGGGFQASSEFPHDDDADPDKIPAMSLGWTKDGTYHTYDPATRQTLRLSESQAVALLHARLHDGYRWHLRYTYVNMTPMHVSYSVVFGPDERVEEVKPVYGWD